MKKLRQLFQSSLLFIVEAVRCEIICFPLLLPLLMSSHLTLNKGFISNKIAIVLTMNMSLWRCAVAPCTLVGGWITGNVSI